MGRFSHIITPKYPEIEVELVGQDGNAMNLMSIVGRELRNNGVLSAEVDEFYKEAMSGDYDNVLRTCANWVSVS